MTVPHLIKEVFRCIYCHQSCEKIEWFSEFWLEHHYKVFVCEHCSHRNHVDVDFLGSGHDDWGGTIESRI